MIRFNAQFSESPIRRRRMQFHTDHVFFARLGPIYLIGVLAMLGLGVAEAQAQWATVRGRVTDQADDQPLPGAALMLHNQDDGARLGTAADGNGYFVLPRIPPGTYVLEASFIGYLSRSDTLVLAFDESRTLDLRLHADETEMDEVVVESQRATGSERGTAGFETIRPSTMARVPMPSVSADLAGYLQTLPGVVTTGDRGGQLFVRGGTPTQNLVMIDGMPIFQPFHIVGFYSA
ncbi:MAG: carboxypeptidase regulatory-like domain-containing protein, partial [Rhodothermales bacterium]